MAPVMGRAHSWSQVFAQRERPNTGSTGASGGHRSTRADPLAPERPKGRRGTDWPGARSSGVIRVLALVAGFHAPRSSFTSRVHGSLAEAIVEGVDHGC